MADKKQGFYDRYTTTQALAGGHDIDAALEWSHGYFTKNYAELLPSDKKARILDIGCGNGRYLKSLMKMGYADCYGIDISEEQVNTARNLGLGNIEHADALTWLENKASEYDCMLALDILEHLTTEDLLLFGERVAGALRPGGVLIVQVPNAMTLLNPIICGDLTHERAFTIGSLRQFLLVSALTPFGFYEIPPYVHGIASAIRACMWRYILRPSIAGFMLAAYGDRCGGIYTANVIAVGKKD